MHSQYSTRAWLLIKEMNTHNQLLRSFQEAQYRIPFGGSQASFPCNHENNSAPYPPQLLSTTHPLEPYSFRTRHPFCTSKAIQSLSRHDWVNCSRRTAGRAKALPAFFTIAANRRSARLLCVSPKRSSRLLNANTWRSILQKPSRRSAPGSNDRPIAD
jgi:hypothetical protein